LQDAKDRDIKHRLTASSIEAEVTLASLWAGKPQVTELVVIRPVLNLPLQRERVKDASSPPRPAANKAAEAFSIEHVSITGGTVVFSNLRDRVENRIETVNADVTFDADHKITLTGNARSAAAAQVQLKATHQPPSNGRIFDQLKVGARPAAPLSAGRTYLQRSVVMINGVAARSATARSGWASVDLASERWSSSTSISETRIRVSRSTRRLGAAWAAQIGLNRLLCRRRRGSRSRAHDRRGPRGDRATLKTAS
jgi:AsmA protein